MNIKEKARQIFFFSNHYHQIVRDQAIVTSYQAQTADMGALFYAMKKITSPHKHEMLLLITPHSPACVHASLIIFLLS